MHALNPVLLCFYFMEVDALPHRLMSDAYEWSDSVISVDHTVIRGMCKNNIRVFFSHFEKQV